MWLAFRRGENDGEGEHAELRAPRIESLFLRLTDRAAAEAVRRGRLNIFCRGVGMPAQESRFALHLVRVEASVCGTKQNKCKLRFEV